MSAFKFQGGYRRPRLGGSRYGWTGIFQFLSSASQEKTFHCHNIKKYLQIA